jgi:hypothetical protein
MSLDSFLLNTSIPKKKVNISRNYNNLKGISIANNINTPKKTIKRSFSATNNLLNTYQNISNTFLKLKCNINENKKENLISAKNDINEFINKLKTISDIIPNKKNKSRNENNNILNHISPKLTHRIGNSLEKSLKNIFFIRNDITWEYKQRPIRRIFSREHELEKMNKMFDSNRGININVNEIGNNYLKSSYQINKKNNSIKNGKNNSNLTTSNVVKSSKNIFNKNIKNKVNKNIYKKFEYNRDYLKPFKKEKINKKFPINDLEIFTNGLMVSPYE